MNVHRVFSSVGLTLLPVAALACGGSSDSSGSGVGGTNGATSVGVGNGGAAVGSTSSVGSGGSAASGSSATASVGTGGTMNTCGNGAIEAGEDCDGTNLGSATCSSLGFSSGTLACTASCHFDTTACTGAITPTATPSRTTCAAPCGVFFDATATTGLMNGDFVGANFDWDFDDPNSPHKHTIGFVVAHVFDTPGTYQVAVSVRDTSGKSGSTTIPITVTAMPGTTYYVAASGSDTNTGTTMGSPLATLAKALAVAKAPASILLQRGDSFNLGDQTTTLSVTGPFLIGAYGAASSPAPILNSTVSAQYGGILPVGKSKDLRLTDLHFKSNQGTFSFSTINTSTDTLFERLEVEGIGNEQVTGEIYYVAQDSHDTFIVDGNLHGFVGYGVFGGISQQVAFIGTSMTNITGGQPGFRIQGGTQDTAGQFAMDTYVAESSAIFSADGATAESFTFRGDDKHVVCVGNTGNHYMSFAPQNLQNGANEHVSYVLAEGNTLDYTFAGDPFSLGFVVTAQHVVVRNNLFVNTGVAVDVDGEGAAGPLPANWVDDVAVYNNTHYVFPPVGGDAYLNDGFQSVTHGGTTGSLIVKNNIFVEGALSDSQVFFSDHMSTNETVDHNLIYAPKGNGTAGTNGVVGDPKFASTDITQPNAFQLSAGSPAIDVGAMVPVYRDKLGTSRPQGAGWDMGAFEYKP